MNAQRLRPISLPLGIPCLLALACLYAADQSVGAATTRVALVQQAGLPPPAEYGLRRLTAALQAHDLTVRETNAAGVRQSDFVILAGLTTGPSPAARQLRAMDIARPAEPEALAVQHTTVAGQPALVLCGADARGLMYAALDTAERIGWSKPGEAPWADIPNTAEQPFIRERAVSIYTMQRAWFERRLHDERHWEKYFDLLAQSRINSFVVIFGYENGGFLAPPYPYFFDVPGFPKVEMVGLTPAQQQRNRRAFQRMIELAHERGIGLVPAIWDHIYRGGVQGGGIAGAAERAGKRTRGLVSGVTPDNLVAYNQAALRRFLGVFPAIDGLQFRMHGESGLRRGEMQGFWHEIFRTIKELRPNLRVDTRAKQLPDAIIADGLAQGVRLRVATKYWMEQMGLPFHPTHVNRPNQKDRRHGYADLLRFPQTYQVHWRLWNGGTTRLLLWGDPDYVRRFAESARVYGGDSLEVNEMLATWMLGEAHDTPPWDILNPRYRYYEYPGERYWHFYQVWGRVSYNPATSPELWEREFQKRFGIEAGRQAMAGLHLASRVLPRIVAASYRYRYFPTTRGWAEMMRMDDLPNYARAEGSDIQQFMNMRDAARSRLDGTDTAMRRPAETSRWFADTAREILEHAAQAEAAIGERRNREFISTLTDLRLLAYLAQYHAHRLQAGVAYNLYLDAGDQFAWDDAIQFERQAVAAWERMVQAAGDVYTTNLAFGVHRVGFSRHWREELDKLRNGLKKLIQDPPPPRKLERGEIPFIAHVPVRRLDGGQPLVLRATVKARANLRRVVAHVQLASGEIQSAPLNAAGPDRYQATIPIPPNTPSLRYSIEAVDEQGRGSRFPAAGAESFIAVSCSRDHQPPEVELNPITKPRPGQPVTVTAKVSDLSGVKWVRLRYRHLTQFEDYQTLEMVREQRTGNYQATVPGEFLTPEWDLMYFVEAVDQVGNGRMYPDLENAMPYVIVPLER